MERRVLDLEPSGLEVFGLEPVERRSPVHHHPERSHRIDAEDFYRMLDGVVIDDTGLFNVRLKEWEDFYNFHRPHGALGGQTPYERLREKTRGSV